jgi:hypothetical protein
MDSLSVFHFFLIIYIQMFEFNHKVQALILDFFRVISQRMHQKQEHQFSFYSKKYLD